MCLRTVHFFFFNGSEHSTLANEEEEHRTIGLVSDGWSGQEARSLRRDVCSYLSAEQLFFFFVS